MRRIGRAFCTLLVLGIGFGAGAWATSVGFYGVSFTDGQFVLKYDQCVND